MGEADFLRAVYRVFLLIFALLCCSCSLAKTPPSPTIIATPPSEVYIYDASILENGVEGVLSGVIKYYPGSILSAVITNKAGQPCVYFFIDEAEYTLYYMKDGVYKEVESKKKNRENVVYLTDTFVLSDEEEASLWLYQHDDLVLEEGEYRLKYAGCAWQDSRGEILEEVVLTIDFFVG